jgi:TRAP-type C4-dicarboxylate transport system permease small subunit
MKLFRTASAFLLALAVFAPLYAFAADATLENPLAFDTLTEFLRRILQLVALIGFPLIVLFIVYIGFKFIAAEGKPEKIAEAQKLLFWALVGALIVLGAEALSLAIQGTVEQLQGR